MNYTKGPWKVEQDLDNTGSKVFDIWNQAYHIATINEHVDETDDRANAHLIAAAPELYDELLLLYTFVNLPDDIDKRIKAVLRKAEGKYDE